METSCSSSIVRDFAPLEIARMGGHTWRLGCTEPEVQALVCLRCYEAEGREREREMK